MDRRRRELVRRGAAALLTLPALGGTARAWARTAVVLGQSVPLTGAASEIGLAYAAGSKLYFDTVNQDPKSALRLELRQLDDGYRSERASANAGRLLDEGAQLLFGFVGTASTAAAATVARQRNRPFFAPFAAPDALRDAAQSHVFLVRPSMADEAFKMAQHCATLGLTRLALLGEDDAMGRAGLEAVHRALAELKLPALAATAFVPAQSDQVDRAAETLQAARPQAIIQAALFQTTAAFIRTMRKNGYAGAFLNFSAVGIDPLYTALGRDIGGVVVSQVVPSPRSTATPVVREYLAVIDNSDQTPTYESLEGFIAAKALVEALRRPGGAAALERNLQAMNGHDLGGFRLNLRGGLREASAAIDLVSITADGRVIR